jgi:hypothetical protein
MAVDDISIKGFPSVIGSLNDIIDSAQAVSNKADDALTAAANAQITANRAELTALSASNSTIDLSLAQEWDTDQQARDYGLVSLNGMYRTGSIIKVRKLVDPAYWWQWGGGGGVYTPVTLTSEWTIEGWFYYTMGWNISQTVFSLTNGTKKWTLENTGSAVWWALMVNTGFLATTANTTFGVNLSGGPWHHIAIDYTIAGITLSYNGVRTAVMPVDSSLGSGTWVLRVGSQSDGTNPMPGRIANVRFSQKAVYKYMTAFTPAYPLTTVGTGFVLNGPAGGILATWVSNIASLGLTTTSNPTFGQVGAVGSNIPPSETSYDTSSGNAWLGPLYKSFYSLSSVDWTIEGWFYQTTRSGTQAATLIDFSNYGQGVVTTGQKPLVLTLDTDGTPSVVGYNNTVGQTTKLTGYTVTLNTWTHIVWMRSSGYLYAYVSGQKTAGVALPTWLDVFNMMNLITIGTASNQVTNNSYHFAGQFSQVMVRLGSKYSTAFTPSFSLTPVNDPNVLFYLGRKREDTVSGLTMPIGSLSSNTITIGARPSV